MTESNPKLDSYGFTSLQYYALMTVTAPLWLPFRLVGCVGLFFRWRTFRRLTDGAVQQAWPRCVDFWRRNGCINDWHGVIGMPSYSPSASNLLVRHFAKRFHASHEWIAAQTQNKDHFVALCAIYVLLFMPPHNSTLPKQLALSELPLADPVVEHLNVDLDIATRCVGEPIPEITTLGSFMAWEFQHQLELDTETAT